VQPDWIVQKTEYAMKSSATIRLHIGNAIPRGNENETMDIIDLWHQIGSYFRQHPFLARRGTRSEAGSYLVTLDAIPLVKTLEQAKEQSGSFTRHQQAYVLNADVAIDGELIITIDSESHEIAEEESYQVATAFVQQLVMAAHIVYPGSLQILNARFIGENAHRYEAQHFDTGIFHGALRASIENSWPTLEKPAFEKVWRWLEVSEISQAGAAIKNINKALSTLLKVAEQRHWDSARTALLVMYQLEILLDCRQLNSLDTVRSRTRLLLGNIPEAADCLQELHEVRNHLFLANQPVYPPPLIFHTPETALKEQLEQHNSAVEAGTALVLKLLQDLIAHDAYHYTFTESFTRS
jgi:hypothetical protein